MTDLPHYKLLNILGKGTYGTVFKAYDYTNKKYVAIKRLKKHSKTFSRQFEILLKLKHCLEIVKIEDIFYSQSKGVLYQNIVFEYVERDLNSLIQTHRESDLPIKEKDIKRYMYQILLGLAKSHQQSIVHRDLKPHNILVNNQGLIKICDFGCAKVIKRGSRSVTIIASQNYRAPELLLGITDYGSPVDIWSAGCILAELFIKRPLFDGEQDLDQLIQMFKIIGSFTKEEKKALKKRVLLSTKQYNKLSAKKFERVNLQETFNMVEDFDNFVNLLFGMLKFLPERRLTAHQALDHQFFDDVRKEFSDDQIQFDFW